MMNTPEWQTKDEYKPAEGKRPWWSSVSESWSSSANRQWGAYIVDLMLSVALFNISAWLTHSIDNTGGTTVGPRMMALFLLLQFAYYPGTWWLFGRSLGMYLMSIRVGNLEMRKITLAQALIRFVAYSFLGILYFIPFAFYLLMGRTGRALHDKLARTLVIQDM